MRNVMAGRESSYNLISDASAWLQIFKKGTTELSSAGWLDFVLACILR